MNGKKVNWLFVGITAGVLMLLALHPAVPPPKARAQRVNAVNSLARISITLPATNAGAGMTNQAVPNSDVLRPR